MSASEFSGNYAHNIDPKGRVTIPSAYREALGDTFTIGLNNEFNAIALYPVQKWEEIGKKLSISKERVRQIERQAMDKLQKMGTSLGLEDFLNE